ncbi:MAG: DNA polymerase III subunit alpha, partial [bacterium]|nr:DNA polymerase III subunit alpha [bacterium]
MAHKFVHLHVHSHYSLLEALPKVGEIVKTCEKMRMDTIALTDNGNMYGAIEFYQKMTDAGLKPIFGLDAYMAQHGRLQKRARIDSKSWRLVLLAENKTGYLNLIKLSSQSFIDGFYYKPRIDDELLAEHKEGLICLSGGFNSEIATALRNGSDIELVKLIAQRYKDMFGPGNYFLELVDRPELAEQQTVNNQLIQIGRDLDIPLVVTKDSYYLNRDDQEPTKVLSCIQGGRTLDEVERVAQNEYDASLVDPEAIETRFEDVPDAIENTRKIADRCNVELELDIWNFPKFEIPDGKTALEYLRERTYAELPPKMGGTLTQEAIDRIEYELEIIEMKGFCVYFLIVSDFIQFARRSGIVTTTRAAGSLVSFAVGISTIDPLHYKLPFERFLNPERPSAPDVDADFADNRRDEVLEYVTEKYGADKVAQICTFGKMLARGSVRDVGRALGFSYDFVDGIAKLVPMGSQGFPMSLDRALEETPDLKRRYDTEPDVRRVIDTARRIEGCARHVSIHAAGTVISPTALTDFTPLQRDNRAGKIITQYEMKSVEAAGLVKMDFLGIRNLSILGDAIQIVKRTKGVDIVLEEIPVNDQKTFELLARGETIGVFQLSGDGMTKYLMELKPSRIEDIMAMVALYRPGPIESIPEYIKRKYNSKLVSYLDPRMETILDKSYGVIVYQDDVMLISIHLAGYTWLEADKLRKAMGKKIPEEMAKQKIKLLEGFIEHGLSKKKAQELWHLIEPFAAYGFNKAHAASYGMVAYQTAYMKANYPAEYMTALMTAESGDLEKIASAVNECRRMGIEVLGPDVNESLPDFTYIDDNTIRFGLVVIKNMGEEVVHSIIDERKRGGVFIDLADFAYRVSHRAFNKKSLEAMAKVGALESFGERKEILQNIDQVLSYNKKSQHAKAAQQGSLFDLSPDLVQEKLRLIPTEEATKSEVLRWEKELLGLYLSSHPWAEVAPRFEKHLTAVRNVPEARVESFVRVGGVMDSISEITTKKGDQMAFANL